MNALQRLIICGSALMFLPSTQLQHCYKRCNCLRRNFPTNTCSQEITHLNLYLEPENITVYCNKEIISNYQKDIISFDAKYLSRIDDTSPLTLEAMIKKCYKTKEKHIRYSVDLNRIHNISSESMNWDGKKTITYLKVQGSSAIRKRINISIIGPHFGSNLKMLILNNVTVADINKHLRNIPKIETLDLASNAIKDLPKDAFQNLKYLNMLTLKNNEIQFLRSSILKGSENITYIDLSNNMIQVIENTTFLNLSNLSVLKLSKNHLTNISSITFAFLKKLKHLDMAQNTNLTLPKNIFDGLTSLLSLNLSGCYLKHIEGQLLKNCKNLKVLNMSENNIMELDKNTFYNLSALEVLDLSSNNLQNLSSVLFSTNGKLQHIYLQSNQLSVFDSQVFWSFESAKLIDLSNNQIGSFHNSFGKFCSKRISLKNNRIKEFPDLLVYHVHDLVYLDLSSNGISFVKLVKDVVPKSCNLLIDLSNNVIEDVNITSFKNITQTVPHKNWKITIDLTKNRLNCKCNMFKLHPIEINYGNISQSPQKTTIQVTNQETICLNKENKPDCPIINIKNCPKMCLCYFVDSDKSILVDCSFRNLTKFPRIEDLKTMHYLHKHNQTRVTLKGNWLNGENQDVLKAYDNVTYLDLSSNQIKKISWIPKNLLELNLEDNQLDMLSKEVIEALERNQNFKNIILRENPWECDCKADYLQRYLINHNNEKVDTHTVVCKNTTKQLIHAKICKEPTNWLKIAVPVSLTAFLAFISVLLALYYRYSTNIKIYLYSKNLCLWFVAEEEIDKEKTFDVFVSYSHKDEHFVQEKLLPELENGETPFKICVHYRNWLPGEFINKQIINSVLNSRRTLVVLSKHFMESVWGKMEFRTAHTQAISEGRARVIVVIYEDVDENLLDEEMKAYLNTNTYVKWGDPWFWSKLKYALPHSKNRKRPFAHGLELFHIK